MGLSLLDREGLQLVVVPSRQHAGRSILLETSSPRSVAVGKLCDGGDALFTAFHPFLRGHGSEQAQVFLFDGEAVAPRLEIAGSAMLVQHERRLRGNAGRCDCLDNLSRLQDVIHDFYGSNALIFTVDDFPGTWDFSASRLLNRYSPKAN